jgi:hypothetical protein
VAAEFEPLNHVADAVNHNLRRKRNGSRHRPGRYRAVSPQTYSP